MLRLPLLVAAALLAVAPAAPAVAADRDRIIQDCADDGRLQGDYSAQELRDARRNMPSDVAEYTDCADVLRRAESPGGGRGAGGDGANAVASGAAGGGGSDSAPLTPDTTAERENLAKVAENGGQPIEVAGQDVVPGASSLAPKAARNGIPGTLVAALALLGVAGLGIALPGVRRHLPWGRS